jgi:AraC family transcriptional regulator
MIAVNVLLAMDGFSLNVRLSPAHDIGAPRLQEFPMTIEIVQRPAFHVVGMSIRTKPQSPEIPALWPKFVARTQEIEGRTEPRVTYGVMRHEPPDTLLYIAGAAVPAGTRAPVGMEIHEVAAGSYARFQYPLSRIGEGFGEIFSRLLPSSGYVQAPGFSLERYGESFDPQDRESMVEILIPVR